MTLLGNGVLPALMRHEADSVVIAWLDRQSPPSIWTTAITIFKIRFGIEILRDGCWRRQREEAFVKALEEDFGGWVLPFDQPAALIASAIGAEQRR